MIRLKRRFFTAELQGGLGNQMFQIAHAMAQGWKYRVPTYFLNKSSTPMQASQPTKYLDNIYRSVHFVDKITKTKSVREKSWNEAAISVPCFKSIKFQGYFQSRKNFLGYDDEVRGIFTAPETFRVRVYKKYPALACRDVVSVHVRRGDYLTVSDIHPVVDLSYINKCLDSTELGSKVFIFTDDKKWAKEQFSSHQATIAEGLEDFEEMWMMSLCRTNIISNSSFSWWGAFLNENENKRVLAPSLWFGPNGPTPHDAIYEDYWTVIPVSYEDGRLCCST